MANTEALTGIDFREGYIAVIDKPLEWTSTDVVRKIKYALSNKLFVGVKFFTLHTRSTCTAEQTFYHSESRYADCRGNVFGYSRPLDG